MDNKDRNFRGKHSTEKVLCFTSKHWTVILPQIIGLFLMPLMIAAIFIFKSDILGVAPSDALEQVISFLVVIAFTYILHRIFFVF